MHGYIYDFFHCFLSSSKFLSFFLYLLFKLTMETTRQWQTWQRLLRHSTQRGKSCQNHPDEGANPCRHCSGETCVQNWTVVAIPEPRCQHSMSSSNQTCNCPGWQPRTGHSSGIWDDSLPKQLPVPCWFDPMYERRLVPPQHRNEWRGTLRC